MITFMKTPNNLGVLVVLVLLASACQQKTPVKRSQEWLKSLRVATVPAKKASDLALVALKKDVKKQGNSREGLERVKRAEILKKRTNEVEAEIDKLKTLLMTDAGGGLDPQTKMPKDPQNTAKVEEVMKANTPKLIKALDDYVKFLSIKYKDLDLPRFAPLTKDMMYPKKMSFYEMFYGDATVIEALSSLTVHQLTVRRYEAEVLKKLGAGDLSVY
ncbi:MAG TPA: hypothetical protein DCS93_06845 [Microscillaceae bacterium]|nr:hypothetical protein [Microscillaceae bacterium]